MPQLTWDGRLVILAALLTAAIAVLWRFSWRERDATYRRGVLIEGRVRREHPPLLRRASDALTIAGVEIPLLDECKHFKFIGTTGTGKSTAIRELLRKALERGDRAVFADPDGGYCREFHRRYRGDIILSPFETDAVKWDLLAEIRCDYDADQLASALIPDCEDASAREWRAYARTLLAAVTRRCHAKGVSSAADLWRLLNIAGAEELRPWVAGTPAQPFLDPDNARMFGSIRAVLSSATAGFEFVLAQRAAAFSLRRWICDVQGPGSLFIPYKAVQIAALRSLISAWLRLAIFEAMNQPEGRDQRLWFVIDELDALGAIDGLKDALARLRKFGGRCVLGFQSVAQVSSVYGQGPAQTLIENCGTTLILRCSGSEQGGTSQFASRLIGDREVVRLQNSRGRDREAPWFGRGGRRSRNVTEQQTTETAVMPSELEQLPDLAGYLKTASSPIWRRVALTPR